ncbi:LacI family DNA-binding transcriptional regulator [Herbiconiux sp. 11R-BC]|uniref:LacI family DNA-binding transcriptional regulator n=1 Tax=Herbiconiux sp. 11R-BC TaxID=3111637 RepID=UPI003C109A4D
MTTTREPAYRATSADVARRAGVSRATVSQILNGHGSRFSAETRDRVTDAAAELRYRPSPAGRALVKGSSDIVVVVVPDTTYGSNLQDMIDRVTEAVERYGMSVVVRFAGRGSTDTVASILQFDPWAVVELGVLSERDLAALEAAGAVTVPSRRPSALGDDVNHAFGRMMTEELLRGGPRRLAFAYLADQRLDPYGPERFRGMALAAAELGLPEPDRLDVPLEITAATAALERFVSAGLPVGIGCYNDSVAIAVLAAGRMLGLSVPAELAVVGADATDIGRLVSPRITSVAFDLHRVMDVVVADLERLHSGTSLEPQRPFAALRPFVQPGETT